MFRYNLRSLLIVLAIGPPLLAALWLYRDARFGLSALVAGIAAVAAVEWLGSLASKNKPTNR